ncbi:hypothetical protein GOP47_0015135 [Adiantum capillus-veneris]|uniref:Beta-galactosidase n=1 Tax=Adiantum capillus-veneris TaxID=13818 RepID=A0A9D4ZE60_ADICA|nr:hypothetical protein GOP47_0015135 [Adiantum capillus-veneris]
MDKMISTSWVSVRRERRGRGGEAGHDDERRGRSIVVGLLMVVAAVGGVVVVVEGGNVSYDGRALLIDGQRRVLISGSIHYPRSTPQMWGDLVGKAKDGGLNVIETYVFWNAHEPKQGTYNFEGRFDLVGFLNVVKQADLYVNLRIGPYVCAEWNYGGFPVWLHFIPGIAFRTNNEPFKAEMERFTSKVVEMMKEEKLFYSQGGPIILAQIENEYGNIDYSYGQAGKTYMKWAAEMALGLNTGVPWIMCNQADAPDPIINTCNGFYCDSFEPNSNKKPKMWTENWTGWFQNFGGRRPHRPVEDIAYAVARFYEKGGTFQNYYMYHGGTNFGRSAGGPYITTSYDYDAPLDEFGNVNQPKWGHLKDLHLAIQLCEPALVLQAPTRVGLGSMQEGHIYTNGHDICAAFLANIDTKADATVTFRGLSYHLPAWSVSILPDCKKVVFNTAQVNAQSSRLTTSGVVVDEELQSRKNIMTLSKAAWEIYQEPLGDRAESSFSAKGLLEQINTTKDDSDYLWYSDSVAMDSNGNFTLSVSSLGHALHVFVNQKYLGSASRSGQLKFPLLLNSGSNQLDLLSMTVGLQNYGAFFDTWGAGINDVVLIDAKSGGSHNLSSEAWIYQVGLQGETLRLYEDNGNSKWTSVREVPHHQPMIWYKTTFTADGNDPVLLDLTSMGKGRVWVNGEDIGRHWPENLSPEGGCSSTCAYQGAYYSDKCATNCGKPSQSRYHVPRSWLKDGDNMLVLFEEIGGDPTQIKFLTSFVTSVCARVAQSHAPPLSATQFSDNRPMARIDCGIDRVISGFRFASYGTPQGACGSFSRGGCHAVNSLAVVEEACLGRRACSLIVSNDFFKQNPCTNVLKSLAVEAVCK